jgi:hypothetical protein
MRDIKNITEEYQKGDFEKRLNLFLECPFLRNKFIQIEQDETFSRSIRFSQPAAYQNRGKKSIFNPCRRLL